MSTTTHTPCAGSHCPPDDTLDRLVRGRLPDADSSTVTEHLTDCPGCQRRIEGLATAGDPGLSDVVRHIDTAGPPSDSAYWRALGQVQHEVTGEFHPVAAVTAGRAADSTAESRPNGTPADSSDKLKLDFLQPSPTPGRLGLLGQFDVIRVVGRGGMGVVLHAYDPCLTRDVAIKILDPQLANNEVARERFCREARSAAAVTHENLVAVHQVDEDEKSGLPYLVMQLVNGESLEQRLRRVGRLTVGDAVRLAAQAAAGLASAHAGGLIHRDIKPGNILIEAGSDKVKLTDFGLARAAEDMKLTRTGFVAGTPLYMAPEQARGDEIDARADLFSLGSVLYEALAGQPPFDGKTPLAVLRRVADESHEPLVKRNPEVPAWLEDVVDRLLEKEPADRFQTAAEVAEVLSAHLALLFPGGGVSLPEVACGKSHPSLLSRRRRLEICKKKLASMVGLFAAGLGVGGFAGYSLAPRAANPAAQVAVAPPADPPGPQPLETLPAATGAVWSLAVTGDGKALALGTESGRISLWDVSQKQPRLTVTLPGHKGPVWATDFTADGSKLVTASDDGTVKVWEVATGKPLKSLPVDTSVRSATISPSGNWVAVGDRFGTVRVFDLSHDRLIVDYQQDGVVNGVAFSPDELTVASVGSDGSVWLWEVAANRKRFTLTGHAGPVYGLGFSRDGQRLATASWDKTVTVWDLNTGVAVKKIEAHDEGVWAVQFSPDGRFLATAGQDGTAKLWDAAAGTLVATFAGHKGTIHALRFARNGAELVTGGRDGTVRIWDLRPYQK